MRQASPSKPEKAQIAVDGPDRGYRDLSIENELTADGYEEWHYGGANWQDKAGLVNLKSGQTLTLDVRLRKN